MAAMLLIGDKVVTREPRGMGFQLDLGAAWKELTGLPFVFAVWMVRGVGAWRFAGAIGGGERTGDEEFGKNRGGACGGEGVAEGIGDAVFECEFEI